MFAAYLAVPDWSTADGGIQSKQIHPPARRSPAARWCSPASAPMRSTAARRAASPLSTADAKTLNRGNGAEPDTLDPHKAQGQWENNIIGDMFIGLMTEDSAANAVFGAAESYSVSDDGLTYRFKIRDHSWSDGVPVTAHDFEYSFRRIANPKFAAQYVSILYPIRNMQAVSTGEMPPRPARRARDRRQDVGDPVPFRGALYRPAPHPLHDLRGAQARRREIRRPVDAPREHRGQRPVHAQAVASNDHVRLEKNPRFYDAAKVKIEHVTFYPTQDSEAALKRVRGGDFDLLTDSLPPQKIDWLRDNMANELRLWPFILSQYVQFNVRRKPFDDIRVRQALSLAIDREIMCNKVERAGEQPAYALIPPGLPFYPGNAHVRFHAMPMAARLEKAKALLAEAGYGPHNPLSFDYAMIMTTETKLISVALQEMWRHAGVNVRLTPSETQVHYAVLRKHDFDVAWAGWVADYRDPKNYLYLFQASTSDMNYGGYVNPKFESLVAQSDNIRDAHARAAVLGQAEQILLDDVAIAPVYFGVTRDLVSPQVRGWISNNVNINRTRYLSLDRSVTTV